MQKVVRNKYFLYTICYWGFIGALVYQISILGLCTIATSDAVSQIYPILLYTRRLWLNFFQSVFEGKSFVYPMVDFTLGMGDDTIVALNYYGLQDPFYILSVFFSEEYLPYFYTLLFYIRVYLGGATFIAFVSALNNKKSVSAYVIGALVYCFTGFTVQSNLFAIFTHAMLYIPLMLLGAENSIHGKKKGVLCFTIFGFALCGFYYLYIGSIALAVFVLYRMFCEKRKFSQALLQLRDLILEYLLGLGLSAFVFVPAVAGFLTSDRAVAEFDFPLILPWESVKQQLLNLFLPSYSDNVQELAVCVITVISVCCVLLTKDRKKERVNIILLFLASIIPFISCVMSGFGACYQRWELVINLYLAYLTVSVWDEFNRITIVQKIGIVFVFLLMGIVGKQEGILRHERFAKVLIIYAIVSAVLIVLLPICRRIKKEKAGRLLLFFIVYISICISWKAASRDREADQVQDRQVVRELIGDSPQNDFYRIENERAFAEPRIKMNLALQQNYFGTMEYVSIENKRYMYAFERWDIDKKNFNVAGLDQRAVLETMSAVKYFVVKSEFQNIVPYGFAYIKATDDGEWCLYENKYALPIAYTYKFLGNNEAYQNMTGLEKQQAMLQTAAVEGYKGNLPKKQIENRINTGGEYKIIDMTNVSLENGIINANSGGTMTIAADIRADCENYLFYTGPEFYGMEVALKEGYIKNGYNLSPLVINLGAPNMDTQIEITITFYASVSFQADALQIASYNMGKYAQYIQDLKKATEGNFKVTTNRITGKIELAQDEFLCVAVPYADGWYAKIDGKETQVYPANDLFMGIEVPRGNHKIEFYYETPYIRVGAWTSIISLLLLIFMIVNRIVPKDRRKRLNEQRFEKEMDNL